MEWWILIFQCVFIFSSILHIVTSICPNACSGHGQCGVGNKCTCYSGWDAGAADCSLRTCPYGTAWVDKAYGTDEAHQSAECSNAGLCDRQSGLCKCFPGFTGSACQRSSCPNDCSGHGTCATIGDVAYYDGPQYDSASASSGNGYGITYLNWDKDSVQLCECDQGFFGADCSLVMCPKGDDPMTINQNNRVLQWTLEAPNPLSGSVGLTFQGYTIYIDLPMATGAQCTQYLANKGKFGAVGCTLTSDGGYQQIFRIEFFNWPTYPKDNNLYTNDGNPSNLDFFCDTTNAAYGLQCKFQDITASNIREYVYCSNRGKCDFSTGLCTCFEGYGGPACSNATYLYYSGSSALPGLAVNINSLNYTSSSLQLRTLKAKASDFNFIEAIAEYETVFFVRGDGVVGVQNLETLAGGHTIRSGGLYIEYGGATIQDDGLYVNSGLSTGPILSVSSKYNGYLDGDFSAIEVSSTSTYANNHYLFKGYNRGGVKYALRADGAVFIYAGGLRVTGGTSIYSGGLTVVSGVTVSSGGMDIQSSGLKVTGGVTINSYGLAVRSGGMQVTGGASIYSGGLKVVAGGATISASGLYVVGGQTITSNGLKVTGGLSVSGTGLSVSAGGATIRGARVNIGDSGIVVTGGLSINSAGLRVNTGGLSVIANGLTVTDGATIVNGGMVITSGSLDIVSDGASITGGLTVNSDGIDDTGGLTVRGSGVNILTGGMSVRAGGFTVTDGLTVESGGMSITGDIDCSNSAVTMFSLSVQQSAILGGHVLLGGSLGVTGGATIDGGMTVNGQVYFYQTPTYSDRRLKTQLQPINNALDKVRKLRGVYFHWAKSEEVKRAGIANDSLERRQVGLIAQEVQRVLPEVVKEDSQSLLSVDYPAMVPLLVEAIRDLYEHLEKVKPTAKKSLRHEAFPNDQEQLTVSLADWKSTKEQLHLMQSQIQTLQEQVQLLSKT